MPSPFPGMDPYLESPSIWPDVHHELISEIRATLQPDLRPRYVARVELRIYISDDEDPGRQALVPDVRVERNPGRRVAKSSSPASSPAVTEPQIVATLMDEEIEEAFLKIIHVESEDLVTLIEVLSPTNKIRGSRGRKSFMQKRREIMNTDVHWVEIDLLRDGTPSVTQSPLPVSDYRILASRGDQRTRTRCWPVNVRQPLPVIAIPLRGKEPEVPLDLGAVFRTVYDRGAYDLSVNYRREPKPPLSDDDAVWAKDLLRRRRAK
ncbi:MAG: DUF4058 family protein [Planctomycetia bacterium]|nr:DUF4058 family protein [Planctomycetia bacterium]